MTGPSDERALALWLSARADDELAAVLARRGVSASAAWRDFYDAAAALLDAAAIERILHDAHRAALDALTGTSAPDEPTRQWLYERALVDEDGAAYAAVAARAAALTPTMGAPDAVAAAEVADDRATLAAAAERAFGSVAALTDLLIFLRHSTLSRVGSGAITAADRRRLIEDGAVADGDELDDVVAAAAAAGLIRSGEREWVLTHDSDRWLERATPQRWASVAEGLAAALPAGVRTPEGALATPASWPAAYPLDESWPERARVWHRRLLRWALMIDDEAVAPWSPTHASAARSAPAERIAPWLPTEIDRVYLQADLSAIAPGPLRPALDMRLRALARRESRAQASTYRFSAESLESAVAGGESTDSMRAFLTELSLTGIPQPLDYLIERAGALDQVLRVRTEPRTGRTMVEADDPHVLDTLTVDHAVRAIGLVEDGTALTTAVGRDAVYWTLTDAHYRVIALDAEGERDAVRRTEDARAGARSDLERFGGLLARLRASVPEDADAAWLERELDQAVRARRVLEISVALPDGSTRQLTIEATGMGGGRLRGLDRAADVERTFPVASITSVRVA